MDCLRRSLAFNGADAKVKYRLATAICLQERKMYQDEVVRIKEARDLRVRKLISKVVFFKLKQSAASMKTNF